jgi:ubiquinone/menaquinone biosynthesis C-methylase UbiE
MSEDSARGFARRAFGRPTGVLGRLGGIIMARMNRSIARRAINLLGVEPGDRVLEIGFGPGVAVKLLATDGAAGWIAGIDPSVEMVEQARARNAGGIADGRVDLRRGSVEEVPFESSTFDRALAINSMQAWPDAVAGLREIRRVLRPGGRVVLGFTRRSGQSREGLAEALAAAGFASAHVVDDPDGRDFCAVVTKS